MSVFAVCSPECVGRKYIAGGSALYGLLVLSLCVRVTKEQAIVRTIRRQHCQIIHSQNKCIKTSKEMWVFEKLSLITCTYTAVWMALNMHVGVLPKVEIQFFNYHYRMKTTSTKQREWEHKPLIGGAHSAWWLFRWFQLFCSCRCAHWNTAHP